MLTTIEIPFSLQSVLRMSRAALTADGIEPQHQDKINNNKKKVIVQFISLCKTAVTEHEMLTCKLHASSKPTCSEQGQARSDLLP